MWHTAQVMLYTIIVCYFVILQIVWIAEKSQTIIKRNIYLILLLLYMTAISIITWIYLREATLRNIVNMPIELNPYQIFIDFFIKKGSIAGQYSYKTTFPIKQVQTQYIGYIIAYVIMVVVTIKFFMNIFNKKKVSIIQILIVSFLLADIVFNSMYYIATRSAGPRILLTFSYPLVLLIILSSPIRTRSKQVFHQIIAVILVVSLLPASSKILYTSLKESPNTQLPIEMYKNSLFWIEMYAQPEKILSDAHTQACYKILYEKYRSDKRFTIVMSSIGYYTYKEILTSTYKNAENTILVINIELYKKHLIFMSLQGWSSFEPIAPLYIMKNKWLNVIYNDCRLIVTE